MDIRYRIVDVNGNIVFCNLNPKEKDKINIINSSSMKIDNSNLRGGTVSNQHGTVIAFSSNREYKKSSRKFITAVKVILNSVEMINEIVTKAHTSINKSTSRLIHNLTSLNAHNIQEVYSLIPQEKVSKKISGQITFVENIVQKNSRDTALLLLRVAKNNAAMKAEFSVFRKLFDSNPELQIREHNVHKVLMNIFYLFFPDFTDKDVKVVVGDNKNTYMAYFDYESVHVALYHVIENSAKYIRPKTKLNIEINNAGSFIDINMDMISLEIKKNEVDKIFEEGISGDLASGLGKSGDGIGMHRAKKILELNSGMISVSPDDGTKEFILGVPYQKNIFTISLPKRKPA